jgi:hypothetical protein
LEEAVRAFRIDPEHGTPEAQLSQYFERAKLSNSRQDYVTALMIQEVLLPYIKLLQQMRTTGVTDAEFKAGVSGTIGMMAALADFATEANGEYLLHLKGTMDDLFERDLEQFPFNFKKTQ